MPVKQKSYIHHSLNSYRENVLDIPIYRYIHFESLYQIFLENQFVIRRVLEWDDTYENWLVKASFHSKSTQVNYKEFEDSFYGQCWTISKETDALWRIYSPDKNSVKIKSTIGDLLRADFILDSAGEFTTISKYIGKVKYLSHTKISDWVDIKRRETGLINSQILTESQFIKRKEFAHEKEIRLIATIIGDSTSSEEDQRQLFLKIEPNNFIKEITFDPRICKTSFICRSQLLNKLGYQNSTKRSSLYDFKPLSIDIVNR